MLLVLALDHIGNVFLYFYLYRHGKLDILSLYMAGSKSSWKQQDLSKKGVYIQPKSQRKIIELRVLEKRVCLFADTFT